MAPPAAWTLASPVSLFDTKHVGVQGPAGCSTMSGPRAEGPAECLIQNSRLKIETSSLIPKDQFSERPKVTSITNRAPDNKQHTGELLQYH